VLFGLAETTTAACLGRLFLVMEMPPQGDKTND
jgi:hypothetical protein